MGFRPDWGSSLPFLATRHRRQDSSRTLSRQSCGHHRARDLAAGRHRSATLVVAQDACGRPRDAAERTGNPIKRGLAVPHLRRQGVGRCRGSSGRHHRRDCGGDQPIEPHRSQSPSCRIGRPEHHIDKHSSEHKPCHHAAGHNRSIGPRWSDSGVKYKYANFNAGSASSGYDSGSSRDAGFTIGRLPCRHTPRERLPSISSSSHECVPQCHWHGCVCPP